MADALNFKDAANRIVVRFANGEIDTLDDLEKEIVSALRATYSIAAERAREEGKAEGRRNAIEKSAELIGRQVEARDA